MPQFLCSKYYKTCYTRPSPCWKLFEMLHYFIQYKIFAFELGHV